MHPGVGPGQLNLGGSFSIYADENLSALAKEMNRLMRRAR
jgi:hypothetical protein